MCSACARRSDCGLLLGRCGSAGHLFPSTGTSKHKAVHLPISSPLLPLFAHRRSLLSFVGLSLSTIGQIPRLYFESGSIFPRTFCSVSWPRLQQESESHNITSPSNQHIIRQSNHHCHTLDSTTSILNPFESFRSLSSPTASSSLLCNSGRRCIVHFLDPSTCLTRRTNLVATSDFDLYTYTRSASCQHPLLSAPSTPLRSLP